MLTSVCVYINEVILLLKYVNMLLLVTLHLRKQMDLRKCFLHSSTNDLRRSDMTDFMNCIHSFAII